MKQFKFKRNLYQLNAVKAVFGLMVLVGIALVILGACAPSAADTEHRQQEGGIKAILNNQPVPDLGGFSFERQVLIDTYIARNKQVNTFTYLFLEYTGKIVKICDSKGYPIPYATQLTNPLQYYASGGVIANPEPNSLYTPASAAATLVQCVYHDQVVPTYWENNVFALPYEVQADSILTPTGKAPSFSISTKP